MVLHYTTHTTDMIYKIKNYSPIVIKIQLQNTIRRWFIKYLYYKTLIQRYSDLQITYNLYYLLLCAR